ncbi:MAG TPA: type VI secretion system tip protein VgrG [Thiothrix sp.]|nr:type VI secretion system tip protein VgrG [Thiothrix sp.]
MPPIIKQQERSIEITTPLDKDELVIKEFSCHEELGRLFTMDLKLLSTNESINFEDLLGKNITIRLDIIEEGKRYFNGFVTHFAQTLNEGNYAVYQMTVKPWLWFLTRTADCRVFQFMTVPDIVKQVFRDNGYSDFKERLDSSYHEWEYCVQYRETDFNFISRLLEQEGIYYYFEHTEGKHTLVLSDAYSSHDPLPDYKDIPFYPPDTTVVRDDEQVSSWYVAKQIESGQYALNDYDFERPKADLKVNATVSRSHTKANEEIYDYPGEYIQTSDGDQYARARIEALHTQYEQITGSGDVRGFASGYLFTLKEYPREDQNKEYLLIAVDHHATMDSYESGSAGGNSYSNSFVAIDSKTPFRAARSTVKPTVQGTQTAVIVGPKGDEIYTDKYSRVKLQFHWDRYGKSDENSSCWIRVSQLWAGKNWGGIHIPRIGQEVIVSFLEGDPDRPIITGRVYNADQMPPYDLPANKTQSGIKSRSSKGGSGANFNEIRMEDKKGEEELYIHAEKDHTNITENDRSEDVGHDRSLHVGHNKSETIDNDKTIIVDGTHTETIKKDTTITITEGNLKQTVKAGKSEITVNKEIIEISETAHVHITAATEIKLEVGQSTLLMKSDGSIKLSGINIAIDGEQSVNTHGMSVTTKADMDHNTEGSIVKSEGSVSNTVKGTMVMLNP